MGRKAETMLTFAVTIPQGKTTIKENAAYLIRLIEQEYPPEQVEVRLIKRETLYA